MICCDNYFPFLLLLRIKIYIFPFFFLYICYTSKSNYFISFYQFLFEKYPPLMRLYPHMIF